MPSTYTLISSNTLSSAATDVTFSAIPSTYTDLVLQYSVRQASGGVATWPQPYISFNGVTTGGLYSNTCLYSYRSATVSSFRDSNISVGASSYYINGNVTTANTFTPAELYIPSYTAVQNKPISFFSSGMSIPAAPDENYLQATASLFRSTSAITSINLQVGSPGFAIGSSFYLYGIKNS